MLSVNPCLTPGEVERILKATSKEIPNPQSTFGQIIGGGNLNTYQAVLAAMNYEGADKLEVGPGEHVVINGEVKKYSSISILTGGRLDIVNESKIIVDGSNHGDYKNGRIVVQRGAKLVVQNSLLTNPPSATCSNERWEGIRVHGNIDKEQPDMYNSSGSLDINTPLFPDEAGVVILLGGTTIENAVNAVATTVPGYPWSDQVDRWGGLVIADGVTFRNNFRAAEFSRYPRRFSGNTFKNKSLFSNCYFLTEDANDTRSLGITAWDTDGITVTKSTFKNIGRESFGSIDGSFIIENGNTFINDRGVNENHRHILSMATYPYSGTSVIGSESSSVLRNEFFSNNPFDIFVSASTSAGRGGVQVLNNDFYGGNNSSAMNSAIEIDGPSAYLIKGNFIEASRLINITNTGSNQFARGNFVLCNTINNSEGSIAFREDNSGSKFRGNIFTGTGSSLVPAIFVDGIVDPFQGNASQPANNRFETTQQVLDIGVSPSSLRFNYYYSNSGSSNINAFEPRGNSNYNKNFTTTIGLSNCFSGRPPLTGIKEENIVAAQNQYENVIITANSASVQGLKQIEDAKLNRDNLLNDYIDAAINENNLAKINLFLPQIPGPKAKIRHYGACVELSDFVKAQLLLTEINNLGAEYDDFVDVQLINLDRLSSLSKLTLQLKLKSLRVNQAIKLYNWQVSFVGLLRSQ